VINLKNNNKVSARDLHDALGITQFFANWFKYNQKRGDFESGIDFLPILEESTGGRPKTDYLLERDMALQLCAMSSGKKSGEVRRYIVEIFKQRTDLKLLDAKQIAFAYKVIDCFKYLDNQKKAYGFHKDVFVENYTGTKNPFIEFNSYRSSIVGWTKEKVDEALRLYLGENRAFKKSCMSENLSIMDSPEAIRVACLDMLFGKGENVKTATDFSNMVSEIAKEMEVKVSRKNEDNLFQASENESNLTILIMD
jgi:phage anti-repressor protein